MGERPILFSGPMVRAILEGRKTQTRRVITPRSESTRSLFFSGWGDSYILHPENAEWLARCLQFQVNDLLWVRENFYLTDDGHNEFAVYAADEDAVTEHIGAIAANKHQFNLSDDWAKPHLRLRPSIFMPRWASRLTLQVTDVRVQRLWDIDEDDAESEGAEKETVETEEQIRQARFGDGYDNGYYPDYCYVDGFRNIWDSLNAKRDFGWNTNPWVVAYTFEVINQNIDEILEAA